MDEQELIAAARAALIDGKRPEQVVELLVERHADDLESAEEAVFVAVEELEDLGETALADLRLLSVFEASRSSNSHPTAFKAAERLARRADERRAELDTTLFDGLDSLETVEDAVELLKRTALGMTKGRVPGLAGQALVKAAEVLLKPGRLPEREFEGEEETPDFDSLTMEEAIKIALGETVGGGDA